MNNQFDMLAKVALNEVSLGDYVKAAARTAGRAVGTAAQAVGNVYQKFDTNSSGSIGKMISKTGDILQKVSKPSEVFELQRKKALPSKGDTLSLLAPPLKGVNRFNVSDVKADPKKGINITATPQTKISDKFDKIIITASGENGLQSGSATVTFYLGNTLSTIKPIQTATKRTDVGGKNTWQLASTGVKQRFNKDLKSKKNKKDNNDEKAASEPVKPKPKPGPTKTKQKPTKQPATKAPKKFNTPSTKSNLKYNTAAPSPHTGIAAGTYGGKSYPPPSGIKI